MVWRERSDVNNLTKHMYKSKENWNTVGIMRAKEKDDRADGIQDDEEG